MPIPNIWQFIGALKAARITKTCLPLVVVMSYLVASCGGGGNSASTAAGAAPAAGTGTQSTPPPSPSGLSYKNAPPYFMRNVPIGTFTPTVSGGPTGYSVSPALPGGLTLDTKTGALSGTPVAIAASISYTVTASNAQGSTTTTLTFAVQTGPTFQLQVTASGLSGGTLHYQWQATDGAIQNVDAVSTSWTAPTGPGEHFVYVVVRDGKGGYAEARIAINTDFTGAQAFVPSPVTYRAGTPTLGLGASGPIRFFVTDISHFPAVINASGFGINVYSPTLRQRLGEVVTWADSPLTLDAKGSAAFLSGFPPASVNPFSPGTALSWQTACNAPPPPALIYGYGYDCGPAFGYTTSTWYYTSSTYPVIPLPIKGAPVYYPTVAGHATLADGSPPGIRDPFFGLNVTATAAITGCSPDPCASVPVNAYGDFAVPVTVSITTNQLTISAENAAPAQMAIPAGAATQSDGFTAGTLTLQGTAAPVITAMTATFESTVFKDFQNVLPNKTNAPSDLHPEPDTFLAFKGGDTRQSACFYYQAIRAVSSCDNSGNLQGAINFEDWKKAVAIDQYATGGAHTTVATYVNVVDLNLTREHHSISYGPNQVATYVCNRPGPVDANGNPLAVDLTANPLPPDQQQAVDAAVANATAGKNLIACVAMDYVQDSTYQSGQTPATRFLIFGPSGELLPSVNLDGRGEKFVPGACVACHGGDTYAGQFPAQSNGSSDIGSHFLPYDVGNFAFSSATGFTKPDLQKLIYQLNQNILNTNVTPATSALIAGWYTGNTTLCKSYVPPALCESYVPQDWLTFATNNPGSNAVPFYQNVIARSCRTCHAALPLWNWDATPPPSGPPSAPPVAPAVLGGPQGIQSYAYSLVCGRNTTTNKVLNAAMPNSLVTFDRFWNSKGTSVDQPGSFAQFIGTTLLPSGCQLQ